MTPPPPALPFSGVEPRAIVFAGAVVGLPVLLFALDVMGTQMAALLFGTLLLLVCIGLAIWPAIDTAVSRGATVASILLALAVGAMATIPMVRAIYPGEPEGKATLERVGETRSLARLQRGGTFDLVLEADVSALDSAEAKGAYSLRIKSGSRTFDESGSFAARKGESRIGKASFATVKPPGRWARHRVRLDAGAATVTLLKREGLIGKRVRLALHRRAPVWPWAVGAGLLFLLATAVAARLDSPLARHFHLSAIGVAGLAGLVAARWMWRGDSLYPMLGAAFIALLGGWLAGKVSARVAARLPWARR